MREHTLEAIPYEGERHEKAWGYELWIINNELYCGKLLVFKNDKKNFNILTKILDAILEKFEKNIIKIEEKENNEHLTELLFIIMTNINNLDDKYKKKIIEISNYKVKIYQGLSNKIIFKLMDILDKYN